MINEIIRQIDNNSELAAEFRRMTEEAYDEQELAEAVGAWFTDEAEGAFNMIYCEHGIEGLGSTTLMDSILQQAIASITEEQWLAIAQHLWSKFWTGRLSYGKIELID